MYYLSRNNEILSIVRLATTGRPADYTHSRSVVCVTTVPLSVCYGALNLLVHVDASNFVPYACDRAVTGGSTRVQKYRTVVRYFRW